MLPSRYAPERPWNRLPGMFLLSQLGQDIPSFPYPSRAWMPVLAGVRRLFSGQRPGLSAPLEFRAGKSAPKIIAPAGRSTPKRPHGVRNFISAFPPAIHRRKRIPANEFACSNHPAKRARRSQTGAYKAPLQRRWIVLRATRRGTTLLSAVRISRFPGLRANVARRSQVVYQVHLFCMGRSYMRPRRISRERLPRHSRARPCLRHRQSGGMNAALADFEFPMSTVQLSTLNYQRAHAVRPYKGRAPLAPTIRAVRHRGSAARRPRFPDYCTFPFVTFMKMSSRLSTASLKLFTLNPAASRCAISCEVSSSAPSKCTSSASTSRSHTSATFG